MKHLASAGALTALLAAGIAGGTTAHAAVPRPASVPLGILSAASGIHANYTQNCTGYCIIAETITNRTGPYSFQAAAFGASGDGTSTKGAPVSMVAYCATYYVANNGDIHVRYQDVNTDDSGTINPSSYAGLSFPSSDTFGTTLAEGFANNVLGTDAGGDTTIPPTGDSVVAHGVIFTNNSTQQIIRGGIGLAFTGPLNDYDITTSTLTQLGPGNLHCEVYGPSSLTSANGGYVYGGFNGG